MAPTKTENNGCATGENSGRKIPNFHIGFAERNADLGELGQAVAYIFIWGWRPPSFSHAGDHIGNCEMRLSLTNAIASPRQNEM